MEFCILIVFLRNRNEKYTFDQKLCLIKFLDLIEANNFVLLCFLRISHILQVLTYCNFPNVSSIEKCHWDD